MDIARALAMSPAMGTTGTLIALKNRTLGPVVQLFVEDAREIAMSSALDPQSDIEHQACTFGLFRS